MVKLWIPISVELNKDAKLNDIAFQVEIITVRKIWDVPHHIFKRIEDKRSNLTVSSCSGAFCPMASGIFGSNVAIEYLFRVAATVLSVTEQKVMICAKSKQSFEEIPLVVITIIFPRHWIRPGEITSSLRLLHKYDKPDSIIS